MSKWADDYMVKHARWSAGQQLGMWKDWDLLLTSWEQLNAEPDTDTVDDWDGVLAAIGVGAICLGFVIFEIIERLP